MKKKKLSRRGGIKKLIQYHKVRKKYKLKEIEAIFEEVFAFGA